jgi:hypothetical protein
MSKCFVYFILIKLFYCSSFDESHIDPMTLRSQLTVPIVAGYSGGEETAVLRKIIWNWPNYWDRCVCVCGNVLLMCNCHL